LVFRTRNNTVLKIPGNWQFIDQDKYQSSSTNPDIDKLVASKYWNLPVFNLKCSSRDYREFLEISMIYLGHGPPRPRGIHIQSPGAMQRARWLAKVLYSIKIWLFREQFLMTKTELKGIAAVAAFGVVVYLSGY